MCLECCQFITVSQNTANNTLKRIMAESLVKIDVETVFWKSIKQEGLDLDYSVAIPKAVASALFQELENTLEYFTGDLSKIKYVKH